jgi:hypothetical protein
MSISVTYCVEWGDRVLRAILIAVHILSSSPLNSLTWLGSRGLGWVGGRGDFLLPGVRVFY